MLIIVNRMTSRHFYSVIFSCDKLNENNKPPVASHFLMPDLFLKVYTTTHLKSSSSDSKMMQNLMIY